MTRTRCSASCALHFQPFPPSSLLPQVLRIYISDEADPFALHVLEVGEEEYALLRADQGIRVDYANFPGKLIGLLDKCIACQGEDLPR